MKKNIYTILFVFLIVILSFLGVYKCPFNYLFGIPCPTCGMTRAIYYAFSLDFEKAFYFHALWPLVILGFIIYMLKELKIITLKEKYINILIFFLAILCISYFIMRHIINSPVVKIDITKSLIYKIYKNFVQI